MLVLPERPASIALGFTVVLRSSPFLAYLGRWIRVVSTEGEHTTEPARADDLGTSSRRMDITQKVAIAVLYFEFGLCYG